MLSETLQQWKKLVGITTDSGLNIKAQLARKYLTSVSAATLHELFKGAVSATIFIWHSAADRDWTGLDQKVP